MNKLNTSLLYGKLVAKRTRDSINSWLHSEKGSGEIIAMVLIIGVVIVLGVLFSGNIKTFFNNIWDSLVGNRTEDINGIK